MPSRIWVTEAHRRFLPIMMIKHLSSNPGHLYEVRLEGRLTDGWADWFGGLSIQAEGDDVTMLRGFLPDQAALLGVLNKIHALNLNLLSVVRCSPKDEA